MTIREDVKKKLKEAMKKKDIALISTLRLVIASIKDKDIIAKGKGNNIGINNEEIISNFLPKQLSNEEINIIIDATISSCGASSMKDMGLVIKLIKNEYNGKMDFGNVSKIIKNKLSDS